MGTDDYTLGRDYRASARLGFQHHLYSETFGYHLHPSIPTPNTPLSIADVGTGTGIWLLGLDRHLPTPAARLCGIDISGDQFPRPEWLPSNVDFIESDVSDPAGPPAELLGAFDIVHLRLFIAIIQEDDPTPVIEYCYKLLKPGGHLQWDELDPAANRVGGHEGSSTEGMKMIARMTEVQSGNRSTKWISRLPEDFQERGFEVVDVDRKIILPWQRGMFADNFCMLADEFVERAARGGQGIKPVDEEYKALPARVSAEKLLGSYYDPTMQVVVEKRL